MGVREPEPHLRPHEQTHGRGRAYVATFPHQVHGHVAAACAVDKRQAKKNTGKKKKKQNINNTAYHTAFQETLGINGAKLGMTVLARRSGDFGELRARGGGLGIAVGLLHQNKRRRNVRALADKTGRVREHVLEQGHGLGRARVGARNGQGNARAVAHVRIA